jgi:Transposase DDE domain
MLAFSLDPLLEEEATRMLLGNKFQAFVDQSPVSVMVRGTLERILHPDTVETIFQEHAVSQYTLKITFAQCVQIMDAVVFKLQPSVGAWYAQNGEQLSATRQSLYDKLRHIEPPVSAALVQHVGKELLECVRRMKGAPENLLPGYRLRILDGNHLAGTEHRLKGLRDTRAAALPGQSLVLYDPRYDLITDVIPCEDAYTQERALLGQVLLLLTRKDCVLGDRNFCTTGFLFGVRRRGAFFVIRQHAGLTWETAGKRRSIGKDGSGRKLTEQRIRVTEPSTGETMLIRRITIPLNKPNDKGETELHVLTNLPRKDAPGRLVADLYARRWSIENAFHQLAQDLQSEIDTLAYPKAALFGFSLACVAYNAVSLVKAALRATLGNEFVETKLSMYYLTLEVARVTGGMAVAIPEEEWGIFRRMSAQEFLATILDLARRVQPEKYTKHKRGPKKKQPKKTSGKNRVHVSTARVLAGN